MSQRDSKKKNKKKLIRSSKSSNNLLNNKSKSINRKRAHYKTTQQSLGINYKNLRSKTMTKKCCYENKQMRRNRDLKVSYKNMTSIQRAQKRKLSNQSKRINSYKTSYKILMKSTDMSYISKHSQISYRTNGKIENKKTKLIQRENKRLHSIYIKSGRISKSKNNRRKKSRKNQAN